MNLLSMDALPFPPTPTPNRRRPPTTPPVFLRDFAYPDSAVFLLPEPMRAARGSIQNTSARTFAEYVNLPLA